jgi:hypothetical protein
VSQLIAPPERPRDEEQRVSLWRRLVRRTIGAGHGHLIPALALSALTLWMMRAFLLTPALPAGTDMLGFIARARANPGVQLFSVWSSPGYGGLQTVTIDQLLGALTLATRSAVTTVKVVSFLVMAGGAFGVYLLTWRWYRKRSAAVLAGAFYVLSQVWLGQWASGHLNIAVAFCALPFALLLVAEMLNGASLWLSALLGVTMALVAAIRPDMVLYVAPTLGLYVLFRIVASDAVPTLRRAIRGCAVAAATAIAVDMYQIIPLLAGYRAPWASTGQLFGFQDLINHSLSAFPSLLGFVQETGYLGYTGLQSATSNPSLPLWAYQGSAAMMVVVAVAAFAWHRGRNTVFLVFLAVLATLMASATHTQLLGAYEAVARFLPLVDSFRDPDRWLILQALACGILAGLTISGVAAQLRHLRRRAPSAPRRWGWGALGASSPAALLLLLLLPVSPTVIAGLSAYAPTAQQLSLLSAVRSDGGAFTVASVPYARTYSFVDQPGLRGYEDDLGTSSSLFTGDPTVGIGDASTAAANFVAYQGSLLQSEDPAFERLMGTLGTKYLLDFSYPDPPAAVVTNASGTAQEAVEPFADQESVAAIPGFTNVAANGSGAVDRVSSFAPQLTLRTNIAVLLGGASGLAALADLPGVDLNDWAAMTSDDLVAAGGMPALVAAINRADLVVLSDTTPEDVAVQAVSPLAQLTGISGTLSNGGSILGGAAQLAASGDSVSPAVKAASAGASRSLRTFRVSGVHDAEVWALVRTGPTAGALDFQMDHSPAMNVTPLSMADGAFSWVLAGETTLASGTHTLTLTARDSSYGSNYDVADVRVVDAGSRQSASDVLSAALSAHAANIAYVLDAADAQKWGNQSPAIVPVSTGAATASFWSPADASHVTVSNGAGQSAPSVEARIAANRRYYTIVRHQFATPVDWSGAGYVTVAFQGTGRGERLQLVVLDAGNGASTIYTIVDDKAGLRSIALSTNPVPGASAPFDWSQVGEIRISSPQRQLSMNLVLGLPALTDPWSSFNLSAPIAPVATTRDALVEGSSGAACPAQGAPTTISGGAPELTVALSPAEVADDCRIVVLPAAPISARPNGTVQIGHEAGNQYTVVTTSPYAGVLMVDTGYDPGWTDSLDGHSSLGSVPLFSLVNGFAVPPGKHTSTIAFAGDWTAVLGAALSVGTVLLLGVLSLVALLWRRRRRTRVEIAQTAIAHGGRPQVSALGVALRLSLAYMASGVITALLILAAGPGIFSLPVFVLAPFVVLLLWFLSIPWWLSWLLGTAVIVMTAVASGLGHAWGADGLALLALILFVNAALGIVTAHFHTAETHARGAQVPAAVAAPEQLVLAQF